MLTNNWYRLFGLACVWNNGTQRYVMQYNGTSKTIYGSPDDVVGIYPSELHKGMLITKVSDAVNRGYAYLLLGDGTVEPTANDYALSGNIISTVARLSTARSTYVNGNDVRCTMATTVKNTSADPITVTEVAWLTVVDTYKTVVMVDRTLLDKPVTIPANETGVINYTVAFTLPVDIDSTPTSSL